MISGKLENGKGGVFNFRTKSLRIEHNFYFTEIPEDVK